MKPSDAVPAELVSRWAQEAISQKVIYETQYIANKAAAYGREPSARQVGDLAMLVGRLAQALKNANKNNDLASAALDYLRRHGLPGSPLRTENNQEPPK